MSCTAVGVLLLITATATTAAPLVRSNLGATPAEHEAEAAVAPAPGRGRQRAIRQVRVEASGETLDMSAGAVGAPIVPAHRVLSSKAPAPVSLIEETVATSASAAMADGARDAADADARPQFVSARDAAKLVLSNAAFPAAGVFALWRGMAYEAGLFVAIGGVSGLYHYCDVHCHRGALCGGGRPFCKTFYWNLCSMDHALTFFVIMRMALVVVGVVHPLRAPTPWSTLYSCIAFSAIGGVFALNRQHTMTQENLGFFFVIFWAIWGHHWFLARGAKRPYSNEADLPEPCFLPYWRAPIGQGVAFVSSLALLQVLGLVLGWGYPALHSSWHILAPLLGAGVLGISAAEERPEARDVAALDPRGASRAPVAQLVPALILPLGVAGALATVVTDASMHGGWEWDTLSSAAARPPASYVFAAPCLTVALLVACLWGQVGMARKCRRQDPGGPGVLGPRETWAHMASVTLGRLGAASLALIAMFREGGWMVTHTAASACCLLSWVLAMAMQTVDEWRPFGHHEGAMKARVARAVLTALALLGAVALAALFLLANYGEPNNRRLRMPYALAEYTMILLCLLYCSTWFWEVRGNMTHAGLSTAEAARLRLVERAKSGALASVTRLSRAAGRSQNSQPPEPSSAGSQGYHRAAPRGA